MNFPFGIISAQISANTPPSLSMPADYSQPNSTISPGHVITVSDAQGGSIDVYVGSDDDTIIDSVTGILITGSSSSTYDFGLGVQACRKKTISGPGTVTFGTAASAGTGLPTIMCVAVDSGGLASDPGFTSVTVT